MDLESNMFSNPGWRHPPRRRAEVRPRPWLLRRPVAWALLAIFAAGGCEKGKEGNTYAPPPPPEVIVAHPVKQAVVAYKTYTGVVEASATVELRARVQGFLEKISFNPGQAVKKGDVLFEIDKRQYQASVDQAKARVQAKEAALVGAENDARLARELADQRAGPEIDAIIKLAQRDVVKADLAQARAELTEAELNLDYCTITAPIDGRITKNLVDTGNLVGRGEPTLLATIVQDAPAYVSIDASEADVLEVRRDATHLKNGQEPGQISPGEWRPCELALAGETDFKTKGRVDYVNPELNRDTGTLSVRTRYDNADGRLIPGFFSRVRFAISSSDALVVPEAALLSDQQGRYAMVVNENNTVEVKRVKIGVLDGALRVVESGLGPDDRVIVLGVLKARPGSKVTPKKQEAAPADR